MLPWPVGMTGQELPIAQLAKEREPAFHGTGTQDRLALARIAPLVAHRLSVFNFYSARDSAA